MSAERVTARTFFLDTNVVVYSFWERDSIKRDAARALVEADGAWISTQVLSELAHVLTRRLGVPVPEARERISIAAGCEMMLVSPPIVYEALRIKERFGYNFYDGQIIAAALACGASVLYSEDLHRGQMMDGRLSIRSPFRLRAEQRAKPYKTRKRSRRRTSLGIGRRDGTVTLFRTMLRFVSGAGLVDILSTKKSTNTSSTD